MSKNCLYLSEDTYVCTSFENLEPVLETELQTEQENVMSHSPSNNNHDTNTLCKKLDWFTQDPLSTDPIERNKRIRSTSDSCHAIYILPEEGPFTNHNDPAKHEKCAKTFDWYDKEIDQIFPSNGCLRLEYHKNIQAKQATQATQATQKETSLTDTSSTSNGFQPGCYFCNVDNNERGCIKGQNVYFSNEYEATQACQNEKACDLIIRYTDKNETRFYMRNKYDHKQTDDKCVHKFIS
jgi:hypothetical protein